MKHATSGSPHSFSAILLAAYLSLLVYGALFPLSDWDWTLGGLEHFLALPWPTHVSTPDLLVNLLVFMPAGLLLARVLTPLAGRFGAVFLATLACAALTASIEYLQMFLPDRVASPVDMALNLAGGFAGATLAFVLRPQARLGRLLHALRERRVIQGRIGDLGLMVLALFALSQLTPLVPSFDIGNLRKGVSPLWQFLQDPATFQPPQAAIYALQLTALALLMRSLLNEARRSLRTFALFILIVLLLKVPVISRQLSAEAIAGYLAALACAPLLGRSGVRGMVLGAALLLIVAHAIDALRPGDVAGGITQTINWIPFRAHVSSLIGIADILAGAWPFLALSYLALRFGTPRPALVATGGGLAIAAGTFTLEWLQQDIPGRFPDITDVLMATTAWLIPWFAPGFARETQPATGARAHESRAITPITLLTATALSALAVVFALHSPPTALEQPLDERRLHRLPGPDDLPPARLPGFRFAHPRLPAPERAELARLAQENPDWLRKERKRADNGLGRLESAILVAFVEPGSIDLDTLHQRLIALEPSSRGHGQAKPLAMAYDWLYAQWSDTQRAALRDKLAVAIDYLIWRIREKDRLSPYNVGLYNSPFQALIAANLALYGDDPRADHAMRFTQDYWINRVLPVWRQVMGRNGGWHEGGEYIGIGIGEALYQVPAMWRKATGEDFFRTESGLRGFLDFQIHRTRPDGTHMRLGDAAHFDRASDDQRALAMEYGFAAGYANAGCPKRPVPSSWPWGPLTDNRWCDRQALLALPLSQHFDGIGLIAARSDWTPRATWVLFKAGDHYWSHSHLDQGSFQIWRGGALAIDSGAYGPSYGSAHHMNYAMQSIAHNTVTVTDPADTVPAPRREAPPEPYANEGGQRRIGSGWGIDAAPLDHGEWETKREIYETGDIAALSMDDDLTVAVADLTAAYTNRLSGEGSFAHRTRRVASFWRVFLYDRSNDTVLVFDRVVATRPEFRKRWLLHSLEEPLLQPDGFIVEQQPGKGEARAGGRLTAQVLLPERHLLKLAGGDGHEFEVDGRNYDENGSLQAWLKRRPEREAGAWRVELSPQAEQMEDLFLVALVPGDFGVNAPHRIERLAGPLPGALVIGPARRLRLSVTVDAPGANVRVERESGHVEVQVMLPKVR